MAEVTIYVTNYCAYCVRAKGLLDRKRVPYTLIDVTGDHAKRDWLVEVTGRRTVPQVFINHRPVGGSDELHALERSGELDVLLGRA